MLHLFEWFISWIMRFLNRFSYIFWCLWFQLEWNYWNYSSIGYVCQSLFYWFHVFQLLCLIGFMSVSHCSTGCMYVSYSLISLMYVSLQRLSVHLCAPARVIPGALILSYNWGGPNIIQSQEIPTLLFCLLVPMGYSWKVIIKCLTKVHSLEMTGIHIQSVS